MVSAPLSQPRAFDPTLLLLGLFCLIWSSAFAAAKIALHDSPPLLLLAARFLLAGALMLAAAWLTGVRPALTRADWGKLILLGLFNNALYLGLSFSGMRTVSSGFAAILISANPVLTGLLASLVLGERMTATRMVGLILGLAGVGFVLRNRLGIGEDPGGIGLLIAALVSLVAGTLLFKRLKPGGGLWVGTGIQCFAGGVALLPAALAFEDPASVSVTPGLIGSLLYLVLVVSVAGYLLWFRLLARSSATAASSLHFLMPPLGLLIGWLVLGEPVPLLDLMGILPIMLGIYLVNRPTS